MLDSTGLLPKIRIRGLRKRFGDKQVLDGVDLDVMTGTSMVVIGGSGSGKSVLLKCILGLVEPDGGTIEIDGRDVLPMTRRERDATNRSIGMLFQAAALFDSLPVWENVAFGLLAQGRITRTDARKRAGDVLSPGRPGCPAWGTCPPPNCPAACRSASGWRAPSPRSPRSCSSTSRPPGWTRSWVP